MSGDTLSGICLDLVDKLLQIFKFDDRSHCDAKLV